jgi:hypothetical protein
MLQLLDLEMDLFNAIVYWEELIKMVQHLFIGWTIWVHYRKLQEALRVMQIISYWDCWIMNTDL